MRTKLKRILSAALACVMALALLPATALAVDNPVSPVSAGTVTATKDLMKDEQGNPVVDKNGYYTLKLSVAGIPYTEEVATGADVVLVVDTSASMSTAVKTRVCGSTSFKWLWYGGYECTACNKKYLYKPKSCTNKVPVKTRMDVAIDAAQKFVDQLLPSGTLNKLAVIGFAGNNESGGANDKTAIKVATSLTNTNDAATLKAQIGTMKAEGATNYSAALQKAYTILNDRDPNDKASRPAYVIFISDGAPGWSGQSANNPNWNGTEQAAALEDAGVTIYAIGIEMSGNESALTAISSQDKDEKELYKNVKDGDMETQLPNILNDLANQINKTPAGQNAVLTDVVDTSKFDIGPYSDDLALAKDGKTLTWTIGDIPEEKQTVTIQVKAKDGIYGENIPTNTDVYLTYTNPKDNNSVTIPEKQIGKPTVTILDTRPRYTVTYAPGTSGSLSGAGADGNVVHSDVKHGSPTPGAPEVTPSDDYYFTGWSPDIADTVTKDVTYTAQYETKAAVTVTAKSDTVTYDGTQHSVSGVDTTGLPEGYNIDYTASASGTDAGTYTASVTGSGRITDAYGNDVTSKFTVTTANGTLTINPKAVTVTLNAQDKVYDGNTTASGTLSVSGAVNGETVTAAATSITFSDKNVGSGKEVTASGITLSGTNAGNYTLTYTTATATAAITPKALTVTVTATDRTYNGTNIVNVTTGDLVGVISGDTVSISDPPITGTMNDPNAGTGKDVDVGTLTLTGADAGNYTLTQPAVTVTISKAPVTITVDNKSKPYGDPDPEFTGSVVGPVNDDDKAALNIQYKRADDDLGKNNVGDDITITATYTANSNYSVTVNDGKLTIVAANTNAVNPTSYAEKYDGEAHSISAAATKVGSTLYYSTNNETWSEDNPTFTDAGTYTVYVYATNPNFTDTEIISATVTISKRDVTLTSATASKVYDRTPLTDSTVTIGGDLFVGDEGVTYNVTGSQTKIGSSVNAFTYTLKDGTKADNYNITKTEGTLTVTAATGVTITKIPQQTNVTLGNTITWTVTVTNTGNADAKDLTLTDSIEGVTITAPEGINYQDFDLEAGKSIAFTVTYKPEKVGTYVNHVEVGQPKDGPDGNATEKIAEDDSDPVNVSKPYIPPTKPSKPVLNTEDHVAYIIGYEDGTVKPNNNITRAEVATIFFRLLSDDSRAEFWSQTNSYSDVALTNWFNNAVSTLSNAGVITGYPDDTFKPNASITRAEFAAIAARFSDAEATSTCSFTDVPADHWAASSIALAEELGWITGYEDGTFHPDQAITRAEAMTLINRVLERAVDEDHMLSDMVTWTDNQPSDWFYEAVQEATNSHEYTRTTTKVPNQSFCYENWVKILEAPDWAALENAWSTANSQ